MVLGLQRRLLLQSRLQLDGPTAGGRSIAYTTYYVDSVGGLDSNDGLTPATAWQTLAKAAAQTYSPYSIIALKGGQTITGTLDLSASVSALVTPAYDMFQVTSYGVGRATIQPSSGQGIIIYDAPGGWTVNNINVVFSGTAAQAIYFGCSSRRMRYCKVTNCDITGAFTGGGGALNIADDVGTTGATGIDHMIVDTVNISGCLKTGIFIYGARAISHSDITVQNCIIHDCGESGIAFSSCNGGLNQYNITYRTGLTVDGRYGNWCYDANAVITQFCESYQNQSSSVDGGGFDIDGGTTNCVVQYCYSHDNYGTGILCYAFTGGNPITGAVIRYNVIENNATQRTVQEGGITTGTGGPAVSVTIYGNTVFQKTTGTACYRATFNSGTTVVKMYNNLFYAYGAAKVVDTTGGVVSGITMAGNSYFGEQFSITWNGTTYAGVAMSTVGPQTAFNNWQTATNQEKISGSNVGIVGDPLLYYPGAGGVINNVPASLDAYRLQPASPLITAGLNLSAQFGIDPGTRDYWGSAIGVGNYPVGACAAGSVKAVTQEAETVSLLAAMTNTQTTARQSQINEVIRGMKADGTWTPTDMLQVYLAADSQASLVDWKLPSRLASLVAAPTFAADQGYTTNGTTNYVNSNYNPATDATSYAQNGAYYLMANRTTALATGSCCGYYDGTKGTTIGPAAVPVYRVNATAGDSSGTLAAGAGWGTFVANRSAAGAEQLYRNRSLLIGGTAASSVVASGAFAVGSFVTGGFTARQFCMQAAGGNLTATQIAAITDRLMTYASALGA